MSIHEEKDGNKILAGPTKIDGMLTRWIELADGSSQVQIWNGVAWVKSEGSIVLKEFFPPNLD